MLKQTFEAISRVFSAKQGSTWLLVGFAGAILVPLIVSLLIYWKRRHEPKFEPSSEIDRSERRGDFRVPMGIEIDIFPLPDKEEEKKSLKAQIIEISAGGMSLNTSWPNPLGEAFIASFTFEEHHLALKTRIVRRVHQGRRKNETLHCAFVELTKQEESILLQVVAARSRTIVTSGLRFLLTRRRK